MIEAKVLCEHRGRRVFFLWTATLAAVGLLGALSANAMGGSSSGRWYRAALEQGETREFRWAVGVKGPKHEPLREICGQVGMIEPPQDDSPYVEGRDATDCGSLVRATASVAPSVAFGSGPSRLTVLATLYRPIVRKVTFTLSTGERRVYRPRVPEIPNRLKRGIPLFRYLVASFDGETCIRRITTFDGNGRVVWNEARPPCLAGMGNL